MHVLDQIHENIDQYITTARLNGRDVNTIVSRIVSWLGELHRFGMISGFSKQYDSDLSDVLFIEISYNKN